jgi:glycosyltransferase involved in cell wall biosynthesis
MPSFTASDVTVIVPARNAAETLGATLRAIAEQDVGAPHVIVVDDGSTDDTANIADDAGVTVFRTRGEGPGAARNRGIAAASTRLLAFCDADDVWPTDRLRHDLHAFDEDPTIEILLGRTHFDADDDSLLEGHNFDSDDRTAEIPHFGAATMRSGVFDRAGPIDSERDNYEDYEWFFRASDVGCRIVNHERVVQSRRMHAVSTSHLNPAGPTDLLSVIQQSVVRRRSRPETPSRPFWFVPEFPPDPGGIGTFAASVGPALERLGHEMHFLVGWGGPSRDEMGGIDIVREPLRDAFEHGSPRDVIRCRNFVSTLKAEITPTVYHIHMSDPTPMLHLATSATAPAPTVFTLHNEMLSLFSATDPDSLVVRLIENSRVITGVSRRATVGAAEALPEFAHRMVTIPNGAVIPETFPPLPNNSNVLAIGRLSRQKAFDRLVRTMPTVIEIRPQVHLDILGGGENRAELEALIAELGLGEYVTLHGNVDREAVPGFLSNAQVVAAPSHHEGLPYALLEAAAHGRPIVASRTGGIEEIVMDGDTGTLIDKAVLDDDPTALGRAIAALLEDPELANRFGTAGRSRVEQFFSVEGCARSYDHVYRSVTAPIADVAVIIPAYNSTRHLSMTLESVLASAQAVDASVQILVVDDGSTDESATVAARYAGSGVELFRQPNLGTPMARNAGIALTNSRYIAHLDADDLWPKGRLASLLAPLEADPDLDAVFGQTVEFADADVPEWARWDENPVAVRMPTVGLLRREAHETCGAFAPNRTHDQMGWAAKALANGLRYSTIDEVVLQRRIHATNQSHVRPFREDQSRVAIVKAALDARRRRGPDGELENEQPNPD